MNPAACVFRHAAVVVAITVTAQCAFGQVVLPDNGFLTVKMRPQATGMWCWAASAQMVMESLGKLVSQCDEANKEFGRTDCCSVPTPEACVNGGWPEFDKYGFSYKLTNDAALSWDALRTEISTRKTPFAFSWHWSGGGGHMMVVRGFSTINGRKFVSIDDPWPPQSGDARDITYDEYVQGDGHTHWNDFYAVSANAKGAGNIASIKLNRLQLAQSESARDLEINDKAISPRRGIEFKAAMTQSISAASQSLETFKELDKRTEIKLTEKATVKLGDPFPLVRIGLNELRNSAPGSAKDIIGNISDRVLYPIQALEEVKSGVTVQKKNEVWKDVSYGNVALTRQLVKVRRTYAAEHKISMSDFYVVSIPALNVHFVATNEPSGVVLIPAFDDATTGLKAGVPQNAADVMPKLVLAAQRHNGLPR